ncbi:type II toxin-antitoxin system VapC family toxin [Prosthecobacter sp.]|uniref:type II toxin-antitoxin system VapC family toxin n=1 Tax=Prosthecobacter sp. TaxID=1965333 RepID=UPI002489FB84|nr:type II toxin-antitoxin system VapC family toxin [Prosthecobacter sp.]MDI1311295.1 type II toxin-antitoxin system VapC family toxin [Prosthecobacter sp.]
MPAHVRQTLSDRSNQIWLSYASVWEMQIKVQIGKMKLGAPLADLIDQEVRVNRLRLLSISYDDILKLDNLPMHHRDPFDRMILAQTLTGGFHLVTCDSEFSAYGVNLFW